MSTPFGTWAKNRPRTQSSQPNVSKQLSTSGGSSRRSNTGLTPLSPRPAPMVATPPTSAPPSLNSSRAGSRSLRAAHQHQQKQQQQSSPPPVIATRSSPNEEFDTTKWKSVALCYEVQLKEMLSDDFRPPSKHRLMKCIDIYDEIVEHLPQLRTAFNLIKSEFLTSIFSTVLSFSDTLERVPYFELMVDALREKEMAETEVKASQSEVKYKQVQAELERLRAHNDFLEHQVKRLTEENALLVTEVDSLQRELNAINQNGAKAYISLERKLAEQTEKTRAEGKRCVGLEQALAKYTTAMVEYTHLKDDKMSKLVEMFAEDEFQGTTTKFQMQLETIENKLLNEYDEKCAHPTPEISAIRSKFVRESKVLMEEYFETEKHKLSRIQQTERVNLSFTRRYTAANGLTTILADLHSVQSAPMDKDPTSPPPDRKDMFAGLAADRKRPQNPSSTATPYAILQLDDEEEQQHLARQEAFIRSTLGNLVRTEETHMLERTVSTGVGIGLERMDISDSKQNLYTTKLIREGIGAVPANVLSMMPLQNTSNLLTAQGSTDQQDFLEASISSKQGSALLNMSGMGLNSSNFGLGQLHESYSAMWNSTSNLAKIRNSISWTFHKPLYQYDPKSVLWTDLVAPMVDVSPAKFASTIEVYAFAKGLDQRLVSKVSTVDPTQTFQLPVYQLDEEGFGLVEDGKEGGGQPYDSTYDYTTTQTQFGTSKVRGVTHIQLRYSQPFHALPLPPKSIKRSDRAFAEWKKSPSSLHIYHHNYRNSGVSASNTGTSMSTNHLIGNDNTTIVIDSNNSIVNSDSDDKSIVSSKSGVRTSNTRVKQLQEVLWNYYNNKFNSWEPSLPRQLTLQQTEQLIYDTFKLHIAIGTKRYEEAKLKAMMTTTLVIEGDGTTSGGGGTLSSTNDQGSQRGDWDAIAVSLLSKDYNIHTMMYNVLERRYHIAEVVMKVAYEFLSSLCRLAPYHTNVALFFEIVAAGHKRDYAVPRVMAIALHVLEQHWTRLIPEELIVSQKDLATVLRCVYPEGMVSITAFDDIVADILVFCKSEITLQRVRNYFLTSLVNKTEYYTKRAQESVLFRINTLHWTELDRNDFASVAPQLGVAELQDLLVQRHIEACQIQNKPGRLPSEVMTYIAAEVQWQHIVTKKGAGGGYH